MFPRPALLGLTRAEIEGLFLEDPNARVRAKQLSKWLYQKGADDFEAMTDLPADVRDRMKSEYVTNPLNIVAEQRSSDGVIKLLVDSGDGQAFECVLLPYEDRVSCCISTQ